MAPPEIVDSVIDVLVTTLGIEERREQLDASSALFGGVPELDSLAVMELAAALEDRFSITLDDDDFTGETFETVGSLADVVSSKRS